MSSRENKTKTQSMKFAAKKPIIKPVEMETNSNSNSDRSGSDSEEDTKQHQKKQSVHSDDETTTTTTNNSADDNSDTTATAADGEENSLKPVAAHDLKKGHHVMISGHPCKVSLHKISKTGKHGHMKSRIIAYDVLTALKYEKVCPSHTTLYAPHRVLKTEYQLHYVEETDTDTDNQSHRKGGKSHNNEQDDGIMLVLMDNNNATMSVDLPDSDLKRAVVSARQADADLEYDIFVTLLEAPVQIGGKTMIQRAISGWRKEKADN